MNKDNKPCRILLIEDNPGDYTIVEEFLAEKFRAADITHATSFKQAIEAFAAPLPYDVILLDLSLPDKSGETLVTEMLSAGQLAPIIILTGYSEIQFSIKSISLGIFDYLLKDELTAQTLYKSIIYSIERRKGIAELEDSKKRYIDLFNLSPEPMWVFETDTFQFVQVNNAAVALYGYSESEFLNMTLLRLKRTEDITAFRERMKADENTTGMAHNEMTIHQKKSGEIIEVEIFSTPILLNNKRCRAVVAHNVTEKNLYEHKLVKAIIKTQEDERYEIGSELHDNVCQVLASCQVTLDMLKESIPPSRLLWFDRCRSNLKLAMEEIRNLSHQLAPAFFDDSTLEVVFNCLLEPFLLEESCSVSVVFGNEFQEHTLPHDIQLNLYRILQEQFKNILKYAQATRIDIHVTSGVDEIVMTVTDNGVGFDRKKAKHGIGLANMKRRTELFGGSFELRSAPGKGCTIIARIPLAVSSPEPAF